MPGMEENLEVERPFPFSPGAPGKFMIGREVVYRNRHRLQFVLITEDLAENSKKEILESFRHYPIVQHYNTPEIQKFLGAQNRKSNWVRQILYRHLDLSVSKRMAHQSHWAER